MNCQEKQERYLNVKSEISEIKQFLSIVPTSIPERGEQRDKVLSELKQTYYKIVEVRKSLESLISTPQQEYLQSLGLDIEWGPQSTYRMTWDKAQEEIAKLNQTLKPGEKPWRMLTKEELKILGKPIRDIVDSDKTLKEIHEERFRPLRILQLMIGDYWSSDERDLKNEEVWGLDSRNGYVGVYNKTDIGFVRCVR